VQATVAAVDAAFCVDKSRRFITGFSSGSFLSYLIGCVEGGPTGLFKGSGHAAGNWQGSLPLTACKGPMAYIAGHDMGDGDYNKYPGGRDNVLQQNGCTMPPATTPWDPGPNVMPTAGKTLSCVQYMGCQAPTVFCSTTGLGHNDQVASGLSTHGFWKFWMSLP
jgi:poly(3-hydroxybutyrate) depolymerase